MIGNIFGGVVLALWLSPLVVGLVDFWCWVVIAEQCSKIMWDADGSVRKLIVAGWTLGFPLVVIVFGMIFF